MQPITNLDRLTTIRKDNVMHKIKVYCFRNQLIQNVIPGYMSDNYRLIINYTSLKKITSFSNLQRGCGPNRGHHIMFFLRIFTCVFMFILG